MYGYGYGLKGRRGGGGGGDVRPAWVPAAAVAAIILVGDAENAWVSSGLQPISDVLAYSGVTEEAGGWNSPDGFGRIDFAGDLLTLAQSMSAGAGLTMALAVTLADVSISSMPLFLMQNEAEDKATSMSCSTDADFGWLYTNAGMNGMADDIPVSTAFNLDVGEWPVVFGLAATYGTTHLDRAIADSEGTLGTGGDTGTPRPSFDGPVGIESVPMAAQATLYGIYIFPPVNDPYTLLPVYAASLEVPA